MLAHPSRCWETTREFKLAPHSRARPSGSQQVLPTKSTSRPEMMPIAMGCDCERVIFNSSPKSFSKDWSTWKRLMVVSYFSLGEPSKTAVICMSSGMLNPSKTTVPITTLALIGSSLYGWCFLRTINSPKPATSKRFVWSHQTSGAAVQLSTRLATLSTAICKRPLPLSVKGSSRAVGVWTSPGSVTGAPARGSPLEAPSPARRGMHAHTTSETKARPTIISTTI
mmetsp:Transcript_73752/g.171045  ORF Transcript_73752/g.171045 Transcript_73752/m.171045 type:complete len:225 (+) Transcript_73752:538-1212(+)